MAGTTWQNCPCDYLARMAERPHVQRINADRKTSTAEMLARRKKPSAPESAAIP